MNTPTVEFAGGVPVALPILVNRTQLGVCREPRLALDPGAVPSGSVRRSQAFEHGAFEPEVDYRVVRRKRRPLGLDLADPVTDASVSQARIPVLAGAGPNILACYGQEIKSTNRNRSVASGLPVNTAPVTAGARCWTVAGEGAEERRPGTTGTCPFQCTMAVVPIARI